jgi:hypothetical protein
MASNEEIVRYDLNATFFLWHHTMEPKEREEFLRRVQSALDYAFRDLAGSDCGSEMGRLALTECVREDGSHRISTFTTEG